MGPEPMTSTERRSSRLGMARPLHQGAERVELPGRVVRARRGLRVVLDAERARVSQPDSLDDSVVQVDVADLGPAEGCVKRRERIKIQHYAFSVITWHRSRPRSAGAGRGAFGAGGHIRARWRIRAVPGARAVLRRHAGWRHREPVVVAGDLHPAGGEVLDRLVDATVPETELVGV